MSGPAKPDPRGTEDAQARRWLAMLQTGNPDEKAVARRGLAAIFEARGMLSEAVGLLETNISEGRHDQDLYRALARMYRLLGDEYRAASATLEATRLMRQPPPGVGDPTHNRPGAEPRFTPPSPEPPRSPGAESPPPRPGHPRRSLPIDTGLPPSWRLPLRVAGWIVVAATLVGAAGVAPHSPISGALYLLSAVALGVLLSGAAAPRRLVRLPLGPLGDGALLFAWLLALFAAGALLPRPLFTPTQPTERATPGPVGTPSPGPVGTPSPGPSPTSSGGVPASPAPSPTP